MTNSTKARKVTVTTTTKKTAKPRGVMVVKPVTDTEREQLAQRSRDRFLEDTGREVLLGCIGGWGMSTADGTQDFSQIIPILSAVETDLTAHMELASDDDLVDSDTLGRVRDRVMVARKIVQRLDLDDHATRAFRSGVKS